jgi:hypothetical protein
MKPSCRGLAFALLGLLVTSAGASSLPRRNVLFIPCVDLNPHLGCCGTLSTSDVRMNK